MESEPDVDRVRDQLRTALRDVNDLVASIGVLGLPDGTRALASALRQRLDDLMSSIDRVLSPDGSAPSRRSSGGEAAPPVEESVLSNLVVDLGDTTRVGQLVQLFLNELHPRRTALMAAADSHDLPAAHAVAHTLKSSALLLGAAPLARACNILMQLDELEVLRPKVDDVLQHATASARWFQIWLANQTHR